MNFHQGDRLEMIYMDSQGILTQRHIRVISLHGNRIRAYCYLRGQVRTFAVSNILGAVKIRCWEKREAV